MVDRANNKGTEEVAGRRGAGERDTSIKTLQSERMS